jgi:predicted Zn-dependent protease
MNKQQWIVLGSVVSLFLVLYFGCDTTIKKGGVGVEKVATEVVAFDIQTSINEATKNLTPTQKAEIEALSAIKSPTVENLKSLSGAWYRSGNELVAAHFAEQVARVSKDDESWSVAGGNFYKVLLTAKDKSLKDYCSHQAADAFQNAASLNPTKMEHKYNLALCYVDNPLPNDPMRGILILKDLEHQDSAYAPVQFQLAQLAMKTGQLEKAKARLEKMVAKDNQNIRAVCMLGDVYEALHDPKAAETKKRCK